MERIEIMSLGSSRTFEKFSEAVELVTQQWESIITGGAFTALQYRIGPMLAILHPATVPGYKWQLSYFDKQGQPISHTRYRENELVKLICDLPASDNRTKIIAELHEDTEG